LDSRTRKKIEEVFTLEGSTAFLINKFISENLDNFFRFEYIAVFTFFILKELSFVYDLIWLSAFSITLFVVSHLLYITWIIYSKMNEEKWAFRKTINFYSKLRCIFPKKNMLIAVPAEKKKGK